MIYDFTRKEKHLQPAPLLLLLLLLDHQFRQSGITGDCWFANKKKSFHCVSPPLSSLRAISNNHAPSAVAAPISSSLSSK